MFFGLFVKYAFFRGWELPDANIRGHGVGDGPGYVSVSDSVARWRRGFHVLLLRLLRLLLLLHISRGGYSFTLRSTTLPHFQFVLNDAFEFVCLLLAGKVETGESLVSFEKVEEGFHIRHVIKSIVKFLFPHFLTLCDVVNPDKVRPHAAVFDETGDSHGFLRPSIVIGSGGDKHLHDC